MLDGGGSLLIIYSSCSGSCALVSGSTPASCMTLSPSTEKPAEHELPQAAAVVVMMAYWQYLAAAHTYRVSCLDSVTSLLLATLS